jgi:endo-1,4-beta-D-glucanase Y
MRSAAASLLALGLAVLTACSETPPDEGGAGATGGSSAGSSGAAAGRSAGGSGGASSAGTAAMVAGGAPATGGVNAGGQGSSVGGGGGVPGAGGAGAAGAGAAPAGGVGGSAGSGVAGGAGGSAGMPSPTGARYPFPQNTKSSRCTYPTAPDPQVVRTTYDAWKSEIVTADGAGGHLRTRRPNSPGSETNSTVSEGIAYGMIIAVFMDDQELFDELWKYSQLFLDGNGLMHWYINAAGTQVLGTGGATDSDEDIAWALVMADRQWGGQGSLDKPYLEHAKTQIKAVWDHEIDHENGDFLLAGDEWAGNIIFNPSYFAPSEYRVFGEVSGDTAGWGRVIDKGYEILDKSLNTASGNATNGLAPAWCDANGVPKVPFDGGPTHYQYDSARVPFRIGLDYCYYGEPRAQAYLAKVSQFFANIGASSIVDGYELDGTERPDEDSDPNGPQSAVFVGSAAVGAMHDPAFQSFVNDAYALVATGELLARSRYYNHSWTVLTLAMLTGNLLEYPPP